MLGCTGWRSVVGCRSGYGRLYGLSVRSVVRYGLSEVGSGDRDGSARQRQAVSKVSARSASGSVGGLVSGSGSVGQSTVRFRSVSVSRQVTVSSVRKSVVRQSVGFDVRLYRFDSSGIRLSPASRRHGTIRRHGNTAGHGVGGQRQQAIKQYKSTIADRCRLTRQVGWLQFTVVYGTVGTVCRLR